MAKKEKKAEKKKGQGTKGLGLLKIRKQVIGETLLYAIIWTAVLLVPFMNAGLMSEQIVDIPMIFTSWLKIVPFYILFLLNNHLLFPFLFAKRNYVVYVLIVLVLIVAIFGALEFYEQSEDLGIAWPFGPLAHADRQHISLTVFPWWGNMIAAAMMRYVVYDTSKDSVPLRQDIEFITNYIELMRIRYSEDVEITFTHPKTISGRVVLPPLILIVFVENAFKHGVSYDGNSYIHIDIACTEREVVAHFENSVHKAKDSRQSGIGLENVRKRLDLIYGKEYSLQIEDGAEDKYRITLKIPIINDKMHSN